MKRHYYLLVLSICIVALSSCGKYGYDFVDGFQSGDSTASELITDTTMNVADKSMYARARIFPGLVGETVPRIQDTTVIFKMKFKHVKPYHIKVNVTPQPIFSTGLYAPAGENIKITVPEGVIGLTAQIGVHTDNLTGKDPLRRDPLIFTVKELFPGVNYIKNLYGGTLWIRTINSRDQPVSLRFQGAVRSPDFILGETNVDEWIAEIERTEVPWVELRGERVAFSVPRRMIINYKQESRSVEQALIEWTDIYVEDYYKWMGLSLNTDDLTNSYPDLPERGILDIQPSVGYAHNGNPWIAQMDKHWFSMFADHNYLLNTYGYGEGSWGAFHEVGHNYQQAGTWSWDGLGETTNNLFIFKTAHRKKIPALKNHPSLEEAFQRALAYTAKSGSKNIVGDPGMGDEPFLKLALFLQIYNKGVGAKGESGWDFMPYIYKAARNTQFSFSLDEAKRDFFYRNLCAFTGKDYERFFSAWGVRLSNAAKKEMRSLYPPMETAIWNYNPLTGLGGDAAVDPKYDIDPVSFTYTSNVSTATNESLGSFNALKDYKLDTYWHTCYSGCATPTTSPVEVYLDMGELKAIKGVFLLNRQQNTFQKNAQIYTRNTNTEDWVLKGTMTIATSGSDPTRRDRKEVTFSRVEDVRYIKAVFNQDNWSAQPHVALAEFGAFYDAN